MGRDRSSFFLALGLVILAICGFGCGGGQTAVNENLETARKIEQAVAASPTRAMLVELEKKAFEAWQKKDLAFWATYLHDRYVGFPEGKRVDKSSDIKRLGEMKCDVASFTFSDEKLVPVGTDAVILTAKATVDATCSGKKLPGQYTIATLYLRNGEKWQAAYHNEVEIIDPKNLKPSSAKPNSKPVEAPDLDLFTATLFTAEKRRWAEWKAKNRTQLENLLTPDTTRVDASGSVFVGKQAVANSWVAPQCALSGAEPTGPSGSEISSSVALLTYKGTASGTCDGRPLTDHWGTTIFQKDGGDWKMIYIFETPAV